MKINDLYASVTRSSITQLEAGTVPWTRPWRTGSHNGIVPHNAISGREYSGINIPILWHAAAERGYSTHAWATYQQVQAAYAQVRKGELGTTVVFTKRLQLTNADDDEQQTISLLRRFVVFNAAQIDGLAAADLTSTAPTLPAFVAATGADVRPGSQPMYVPSRDFITIPDALRFESVSHYDATLLHELVHWTGARHRLDRDLSGRFGSHQHVAEELIAEFGAAFLCVHLGISGELRHAGYIASWLALLRQDDRAVFTAASKASQAADFLRAFSEPGAPAATG